MEKYFLLSPTLLLISLILSCTSQPNKSSPNCSIEIYREESNNLNTAMASLAIEKRGIDSSYNISIQTPIDYLKHDVPCQGNVFIANYPNLALPHDTTLVNFRWLDSNKIILRYNRNLNILKKETSIRNIHIHYDSLTLTR